MPAVSPDHGRLIRQLESIADLRDKDRAALGALPLRIRSVADKRDILREGSKPAEACLILTGIAGRYKVVAGGRRQIVSLHLPGDLPDLVSLYLPVIDHSLVALTPVRVAFIAHDPIRNLMKSNPLIEEAMLRSAFIDSSIHREWVANVGRRTAIERIAHVICETFTRMRALGLVKQTTFELSLTQGVIGDVTGLSSVHVNRTLKELRTRGLIDTNGKVHSILDWDLLQEAGDFDPAYLHLKRQDPL
jgi:CRP-like cAMP-binding protein